MLIDDIFQSAVGDNGDICQYCAFGCSYGRYSPKGGGGHRILERVYSVKETFVNLRDPEAFRPLSRPDLGSFRLASPAVV